ncbi:family 78 glycoside hydrolase catalytic domain [Streptococcus moroccensis]|uniref:alpha-L-rhamnosidase n=1 Tax=Streptococcus moroccensis TaxID=1451356 RepID=A0ABT9YV30_9STRE|nr:family 78 glycoside hydrolase catalytic domain [Streptococcus moroccensis]MDQ0223188.1 alpha-L-rhamnosidase [Streptococcus moroccensis]
MRNKKEKWTGRWISSENAKVSEEPEFTLEEMFSGKSRPQAPVENRLNPSVYFKRVFELQEPINSAQLLITCQGIYQAFLNGKKVTEAIFMPDYTDYNDFLMYQTYDVTSLLQVGTNILAIEVADGWYAGRISVQGGSAQFGNQLAVLADLELTYEDGTQVVIGTDHHFSAGSGKHRYADIQIGEKQDLREDTDWKTSREPLNLTVFEVDADYGRLAPQEGPMVYRQEQFPAQSIWEEDDTLIVDFGQVIAGRVRLETFLAEGQEIRLEHAETLNENGQFFQNIVGRNKDAIDIFIGRGQKEVLEPDFTFHGFRYTKIVGLEKKNISTINAISIYSAMERTGYLKTSNEKVNQLLSNILWSQKGNMLSIPTDCPQRERVGWTGDMQVFAPSSTFFLKTDALIKRWLKSVRINQKDNGEVIDYSPAPKDAAKSVAFTGSYSSAGWGDAIIMVPWTLYERYEDKAVLEENYDAMVHWFEFSKNSAAGDKSGNARYIWDTKFHYGDWMFPSFMMEDPNPMRTAEVTKDLVATTFLAHSAELLANISEVLGKNGEEYRAYSQKVKQAFTERFVTKDARLTHDYQGCYVLALAFDVVPEEYRSGLLARLVSLIHDNRDRLDTGFLSVPYLLDVLCANGERELAKTLFFQEACPSWFYEVNQGATTIWESWAGIQPDGKVGTFSFNHYAFGCVLDWIVRETVGLKPLEPGYQAIEIKPSIEIVEGFKMSYQTPNGIIQIHKNGKNWMIEGPNEVVVTVDLSAVDGILYR